MITPPIGRIVDTSRQPCGYSPGDTDANDCGQTATWHIAWDAQLENGLSCDEHMDLIQRQFVYADRHPVGVDCGMPGATWFFEEKRCGYPDTGPAPVLTAAIEAAPARKDQP